MYCIVNEEGCIIYSIGGRIHLYTSEESATKHLQESTLAYGKYSVVPFSSGLRLSTSEIVTDYTKGLTYEEDSDTIEPVSKREPVSKPVKKKRKQRSDKGQSRRKKRNKGD